MEGEREKEIRVHTIPQTFFMPDPSQPNSISQSMQENHQLEQSSRGICIRNLPALGAMPFTHLLALANAASTSSIDMNSAYLAKSLVDSCRTESSSGTLNPGSSLGLHAGSAGTEKSQYEVSTSQQHFYDLNLLPEEIYNTVPQTEAEFAPITPGKPDKKLPEIPAPFSVAETDQMLQEPAKDSFNAGSAATEKKQKRESHGSCFAAAGKTNQESVKDSFPDAVSAATEQSHKKSKRDRGDVLQIKTPQQKPRRKKHRPKVIIEGKLKRS
ncbi:PREDICTED: DEMETER-like protein 2, partial [Tarenaya hassleriana]|uniref:DEMETER-like protein 2 n=1 Tax=Tarenaya hassleriana TaxID=28532 RepID=UPI00053C4F65